MTAVACVNPYDVDSVVVPISPTELEKIPSYLISALANSPQLVKDVSGACCLARMGFRLYAHITEQKTRVMQFLVPPKIDCVTALQSTLPGSRKNNMWPQDAWKRDPSVQNSDNPHCCIWYEGSIS